MAVDGCRDGSIPEGLSDYCATDDWQHAHIDTHYYSPLLSPSHLVAVPCSS